MTFKCLLIFTTYLFFLAFNAHSELNSDTCPNFPHKPYCLSQDHFRAQRQSNLCYAYVATDILSCALRKEGSLKNNEYLNILKLASHYKSKTLKCSPSQAISCAKQTIKQSSNLFDPLGFGNFESLIEENIKEELCVSDIDPTLTTDFKDYDFNLYEDIIDYCNTHSSSKNEIFSKLTTDKNVIKILSQFSKIHTFLEKIPCKRTTDLKNKMKIEKIHLQKNKLTSFSNTLNQSFKNGWPLPLELENHVVLAMASKFENGKCLVLLDDSAQNGEEWVELQSLLPKVEELYSITSPIDTSPNRVLSLVETLENNLKIASETEKKQLNQPTFDKTKSNIFEFISPSTCRVKCDGKNQVGAFNCSSSSTCITKAQSVCNGEPKDYNCNLKNALSLNSTSQNSEKKENTNPKIEGIFDGTLCRVKCDGLKSGAFSCNSSSTCITKAQSVCTGEPKDFNCNNIENNTNKKNNVIKPYEGILSSGFCRVYCYGEQSGAFQSITTPEDCTNKAKEVCLSK